MRWFDLLHDVDALVFVQYHLTFRIVVACWDWSAVTDRETRVNPVCDFIIARTYSGCVRLAPVRVPGYKPRQVSNRTNRTLKRERSPPS